MTAERPLAIRTKDVDRFWAKVIKTPTCWIWSKTQNGAGYGQFTLAGKNLMAHRLAYMLCRGDIPSGLELDHLCRNRACVNPWHLEAVTHRVNMQRAQMHVRRERCLNGHLFTAATVMYERSGARRCKICKNAKARARYAAKKADRPTRGLANP